MTKTPFGYYAYNIIVFLAKKFFYYYIFMRKVFMKFGKNDSNSVIDSVEHK